MAISMAVRNMLIDAKDETDCRLAGCWSVTEVWIVRRQSVATRAFVWLSGAWAGWAGGAPAGRHPRGALGWSDGQSLSSLAARRLGAALAERRAGRRARGHGVARARLDVVRFLIHWGARVGAANTDAVRGWATRR